MSPLALVSVSDKKNIIPFCKELVEQFNYKILSSGGTAKHLIEAKIPVIKVADFTNSPEILGGRVKTLHPKIHGGILAKRTDEEHKKDKEAYDLELIDLVVVNLYPFKKTVEKGSKWEDAIENIDIGGPSMIRSAAKNHKDVSVLVDPSQYQEFLEESIKSKNNNNNKDLLQQNAKLLENVIKEFKFDAKVIGINPGPVVTLYELEPAPGVQTRKIISLSSDIARSMSADDFPDLPLVERGTSLKLNPLLLSNAIKSTLFASSTDDAKQLLTGVNLTFDGYGIESAATDGHRLAVLNLNNILSDSKEIDSSTKFEKFSITLPSKSLREVEKFLSTCDISQPINFFIDKGQVVFISVDDIITIRALEGSYPNYSQLLPDTFENELEFDRKEFISSLERIAVLADQHNNVIKVTTDGSANLIKISTDAQDIGTGYESLPVSYKGDSFQIAFNVRYLLDGLKVIDSNLIKLSCNSPTTPAVFSPINSDVNFTYLVMPIQIRN